MGLYNEAGTMEQENSYNAWGKRRIVETWNANVSFNTDNFLTVRGYTSHEHLDKVNLINMPACRTLGRNGRLYDPLTARMLSPDPFVQNASSTQNFNRYSYCMNNPLKYTDPSGYYYYYDFTGRHDSKADYDWRDGLYMDIFESQHSGGSWNSDGSYNLPASDYPAVCNAVNNINHNNRIINENNAKFGEEFNLYSFKMFNRVEYVLSKTKPQISGSKKLGYYLNTTAETIPLNQYFHFNDFFDFGAIDRDWLDKTQIALGAFAIAHGLKEELITFAAKADPTIKSLKYYKAVKAGGVALNVVGLGFTGYDIYQNGLNTSNGVDFVMGCVAFVPGWGWAVSGAYFLGKLGYEYYFTEP